MSAQHFRWHELNPLMFRLGTFILDRIKKLSSFLVDADNALEFLALLQFVDLFRGIFKDSAFIGRELNYPRDSGVKALTRCRFRCWLGIRGLGLLNLQEAVSHRSIVAVTWHPWKQDVETRHIQGLKFSVTTIWSLSLQLFVRRRFLGWVARTRYRPPRRWKKETFFVYVSKLWPWQVEENHAWRLPTGRNCAINAGYLKEMWA